MTHLAYLHAARAASTLPSTLDPFHCRAFPLQTEPNDRSIVGSAACVAIALFHIAGRSVVCIAYDVIANCTCPFGFGLMFGLNCGILNMIRVAVNAGHDDIAHKLIRVSVAENADSSRSTAITVIDSISIAAKTHLEDCENGC